MKSRQSVIRKTEIFVAPARERGLKYREHLQLFFKRLVAPARERGLKFPRWSVFGLTVISRSREGAWIEISTRPCDHKYNKGRSREGAWIEILM